MGMIENYARLTPAELDRAVREPDWTQEFVFDLMYAESEETTGAGQPRCLDIDKAWDALDFLFRRVEFPLDIVHGGQPIPGAGDWGYGPPRYLTPDQVRTAAAALTALPAAALTKDLTEAEVEEGVLYPSVEGEALETLEYATQHYEALVPFFQAAAAEGDAIALWLS
ncbi:YfbM family protein [Streptomyces sp. NPDC088910]|uniref:YfbM family protein n=1 Tax=Streptomyces sp. NPDC088910 TaxID=3365911 RepID=UPI00382814ED